MPYLTTCFLCQKPLRLRESVLVKDSLSREIKHRWHPECYLKMTEPIARSRLEYAKLREEMELAKVQAQRPSEVSG